MPSFEIAGRSIGPGNATYIIADVGSNHAQDFQRALDSIDAARNAGADAVKFQSLRLDRLYLDPPAATRALHAAIDLEESWHAPLREHARRAGIEWFSTPTYLESVDLLESVGVNLYKLASAQVGTFPQMIRRVGRTGKPVILSTGIATYAEVSRAVSILEETGSPYAVLHCNSLYPTPPEHVHLPRMLAYRAMFGCPVGFSDHTGGWHVPVAAVALGACIVEKHFTLDKNIRTPDSDTALTPAEFGKMRRCIREAEAALQPSPRLRLEAPEQAFKDAIRYRLVARRDLRAGHRLEAGDLDYLRHPEGIDALDADRFLGKEFHLNRDLSAGTPVQAEFLVRKAT